MGLFSFDDAVDTHLLHTRPSSTVPGACAVPVAFGAASDAKETVSFVATGAHPAAKQIANGDVEQPVKPFHTITPS